MSLVKTPPPASLLLLAAILAVATASPAFGKLPGAGAETSFVDFVMKQADTNKDGKISRVEARIHPTGADKGAIQKMKDLLTDFDKVDANQDGELTRPELVRYLDTDAGLQTFVQDTTLRPANPSRLQDPGDSITDVGFRYKF